ncbi:MAG: ArgE/DapE family deacylase [Candidatus Odinarchaeia archaeon]
MAVDEDVKKAVLKKIDDIKNDLIKHIQDVVRIRSVNPTYPGIVYEEELGGETEVNKYVEPILKDLGFETDMFAKEEGRHNLVGTLKGTGGGKSLMFNGHVDVVPPGKDEEWTIAGPWSAEIKDGKIYGRGTTDMKAGNMAAIAAIRAILDAGYRLKGDIIYESVVGEEMMNTEAGTGACIEKGYKADGCINVEPSAPPYSLGVIPASPGVSYMRVTIKGKAVHASMRDELIRAGGAGEEVGVSSIDKAMIIYNGLRKLEEEWGRTKTHPLYTRPGHFTIHPGVITGGPNGAFIISDKSTIEYAIWSHPKDSYEDVKKEVEDCIKKWAATDPWLAKNPPEVEWLLFWPPFDVPKDAPISQLCGRAYEAVMGEPAKYYGFAAVDDAAFLNKAGIPTVTLGPGDLRVAHAPNEYVKIQEVIDAAKIYAYAALDWCGYE